MLQRVSDMRRIPAIHELSKTHKIDAGDKSKNSEKLIFVGVHPAVVFMTNNDLVLVLSLIVGGGSTFDWWLHVSFYLQMHGIRHHFAILWFCLSMSSMLCP